MTANTYLELTIKDANRGIDGISTLLLSGEPGTGKTYIAEALCKKWKARKIFFQLYDGVEKEKLLMDVHLPNLVSGMQIDYSKLTILFNIIKDAITNKNEHSDGIKSELATAYNKFIEKNDVALLTNSIETILKDTELLKETDNSIIKKNTNETDVILDGVLYQAIKLSLTEKVVLILDEIDKGDESIDILLLDVIQNARISDPVFGSIIGNPKNIIIVITSNEERELNNALHRRVRKVELKHPTVDAQFKIINSKVKDLVDLFGKEAVMSIIDISERYRREKIIIKSNVYVLYRIVMDISSLYKKENPVAVEEIMGSIISWFTNKESDRRILLDKVRLKDSVMKILSLIDDNINNSVKPI